LNLPVDEMTKSLFAWIFSFLQMYAEDPSLKIGSKKGWTDKMKKSWIYLLFFHHTIEGKFKDTPGYPDLKGLYINEKKTLRRIAALKEIYGKLDGEDFYGCCVIRNEPLKITDVPKNNIFKIPEGRLLQQDFQFSIG